MAVVSWAHFESVHHSLAVMGYTAEPCTVGDVEMVHVFWHGEHGRRCVGISRNPGTAMLGLAASDYPVALPVGLCPICHPGGSDVG